MNSEAQAQASKEGPRSLPRVIGLICIVLCSVYVASVSTYQILGDALFPEIVPTEYNCRSGTRALYESVEGARLRAAQVVQAEREALETFRSQLSPVWKQAAAVRSLCEKDQDLAALNALRSIELLRYAEERAVRYSAIDLTKWRRRTPELVGALDNKKKN
jgi:hypothetical protein